MRGVRVVSRAEHQYSIYDFAEPECNSNWIDCDAQMPEQKPKGTGIYSEMVDVILSNGARSEDWLINDKWTIHCKKNGGAFPVMWRYKNGT